MPSTTSERAARGVALGGGVKEGAPPPLEPPAEPRRRPVARGRDVDQARLEVADLHTELLEVRDQARDPLAVLPGLRLLRRRLVARAFQLAMELGVCLGVGVALDRDLQQDAADERQELARLVEAVRATLPLHGADGKRRAIW